MSGLRFGYGTNGFGNHRLDDVLVVLAELGYDGVALTLDHPHLDPYAPDVDARVPVLRRRLDELGLAVVIETGGRYVLDPWRKHQPTLLSRDGANRRVDLLVRAVRIAAELGAEAVSFWSGALAEPMPGNEPWQRLADGCAQVLDAAAVYDVRLGFEPEPGMLVDTLDGYERLLRMLGGHERFGLTLDIGHCRCIESISAAECVRAHADRLVNVQIDDMRRGVHEHLPFGEGEVDFPPVLAALGEVGYGGLVSVELPRHGHAAPDLARTSLEFLRNASIPTEVVT